MNIQLLNEPFPHVVIYDFYTEKELEDIKHELKFLTKPDKLMPPGIMHGMVEPTNHHALLLEDAYANRKISDILTIFKRKYDKNLVDLIVDKFPEFMKIKHINSRITKVRYYYNDDAYPPHIDITRDFLAFSYFHSHPRKFSGGELHCTDYNYTLDCSDNTFMLLPSYVKHEVLKVQIGDDEYFNGNGRYCVSQFLDVIPHQIDKKLA
jgi:hypothetical protein